jgi:hypothetical protein
MLANKFEILFRRPDDRVRREGMREVNNPRSIPGNMTALTISNTSHAHN